jgi:hypothetical protein
MSSGRRERDEPKPVDPTGNAVPNVCSPCASGRRPILLPERNVLVSILKTDYG